MLRWILLVTLIPATAALVPTPSPITSLDVDAEPLPEIPAGATAERLVNVTLEGPTGEIPAPATDVNLTLQAPPTTQCQLPENLQLDPLTGHANATLACNPKKTGNHTITVTAHAPPHAPGHWNGTLPVTPDTLQGTLTAHEPDAYQMPLTLSAHPTHLETANATLHLEAHLQGSPLGFKEDPQPIHLHAGWSTSLHLTALHGPGTYDIHATLTGPHVHTLDLNATVHVPEPPTHGETTLPITVHPGDPHVELADDDVNRDGVNKRPGETLITRLETANTHHVNVTVSRPLADRQIPLHQATLPVNPDGTLEHTFHHEPLPHGTLTVTARAGDSNATRTAHIQNINPTASLPAPEPQLADGRPLTTHLTLQDENHGSTPQDPGPIWGLPAIDWRTFKGSTVQPGWTITLGPFQGGPEGTAHTHKIPWPHGVPWANTTHGQATIPLNLTPPPDVDPGTYRISIYERDGPDYGDGPRLTGASFTLEPPPTITLDAPTPRPGDTLPLHVKITNPTPNTTANITATLQGDPLATANTTTNTTIPLKIPHPLPAGTPLHVNATGDWPGRPSPTGPDASLTLEVAAVPPNVAIHPVLDGIPTRGPVAVHPAFEHQLTPILDRWDPNGDPVTVTLSVHDPQGDPTGWVNESAPEPTIEIPASAPPGLYDLVASASSATGETQTRMALEVGEITRLALGGPSEIALQEGEHATASVDVTNAGTVPVDQVLFDVHGAEDVTVELARGNLSIETGTPVNWSLEPGETASLIVHVSAGAGTVGLHEVDVIAAGVLS